MSIQPATTMMDVVVANEDAVDVGRKVAVAAAEEEAAPVVRFGPAWLRSLLETEFFDYPCPAHASLPRNERNYYCVACTGEPLCFSCLPDHAGHNTIQVRRSSYHSVVRASELEKLVDVSRVQTYLINADKVVFLNKRPQAPRHERCVTAAGRCEDCGRGLVGAEFRFCSVGCKLRRLDHDPDLTFVADPARIRNEEPAAGYGGAGGGASDNEDEDYYSVVRPTATSRTQLRISDVVERRRGRSRAFVADDPNSYRRHRRKAVHRVPEQAPFF